MFALLALVAFIIALFVLGIAHGVTFWLLIGLALLALELAFPVPLSSIRASARNRAGR